MTADQANARTRRAWLCFVDESGVKLTPPVRRTWAPKGCTPVLRHRYRRGKQLSMCELVAHRPGQDEGEPAAWMGFDLLEGAYDIRQCIRVLDGLGHQLGGQRLTVIWDNLGAHHAKDLHAWAILLSSPRWDQEARMSKSPVPPQPMALLRSRRAEPSRMGANREPTAHQRVSGHSC